MARRPKSWARWRARRRVRRPCSTLGLTSWRGWRGRSLGRSSTSSATTLTSITHTCCKRQARSSSALLQAANLSSPHLSFASPLFASPLLASPLRPHTRPTRSPHTLAPHPLSCPRPPPFYTQLKILLLPYRHKDWERGTVTASGGQYAPKPPSEDVNAPDLYLPLTSYVTYILVAGFYSGADGRFTPEVLGMTASSGLVIVCLEVQSLSYIPHDTPCLLEYPTRHKTQDTPWLALPCLGLAWLGLARHRLLGGEEQSGFRHGRRRDEESAMGGSAMRGNTRKYAGTRICARPHAAVLFLRSPCLATIAHSLTSP